LLKDWRVSPALVLSTGLIGPLHRAGTPFKKAGMKRFSHLQAARAVALSSILGASLALASPYTASAEVAETRADGFVTRDKVQVAATPLEAWLALTRPGLWWDSNHTWSGDAANMMLTPQAGGCFCERIPGDDSDNASAIDGSVRHMTVVQAYPLRVLRMRGGLGPLQSEPATGVLTITLKEIEGGTRILWEYNVGGPMRYEIGPISKLVDGVISQQLAGLGAHLGLLEGAAPAAEPAISAQDLSSSDAGSAVTQSDAQPASDQNLSLEERIDALGRDE
jgi:hypothetical protein